jgi:hypothetical protein
MRLLAAPAPQHWNKCSYFYLLTFWIQKKLYRSATLLSTRANTVIQSSNTPFRENFSENQLFLLHLRDFREKRKMLFRFNPSPNISMSDSGLSDIGLNFFIVGLIRYRTRGLQSDKLLSDIGLGCIDVGYRILATKIFDVAPTYVSQ